MSTISRLLIIIRCYSIYFFRIGKKRDTEIKNILVVQTSQLGDMVCTTPIFRAIKKAISNAKLTVLGSGKNRELLFGNKDVDDYIPYDSEDPIFLAQKIKSQKFDAAVLVNPGFSILAALYLSGIKTIIAPKVLGGFCPAQTRAYKVLLRLATEIEFHFERYAPAEYLNLLQPLGIQSRDTSKHLAVSDEAKVFVQNIFEKNSLTSEDFIIGMTPVAGNDIKEWPTERFAALANHLISTYNAGVVITGAGDTHKKTELLYSLIGRKDKVINTEPMQLSLEQLKALISKFNLLIAVDTGPIYIAEAFNIPTIDIVGPLDEREQPPTGSLHINIVPDRKLFKPALHIMNAKVVDFQEAREQVLAISSEQVIAAADALIPKIKNEY